MKKNNLTLNNILSCATDGAPAMSGKYKGFCGLLKKECPSIFTIHCVVHRQHLVAKKLSDDLNNTLTIVIKVVNLIKSKQHALNTRLFKELCNENEEDFETLVMHTKVRWLSKGNCLIRFWNLFSSIVQFLEQNHHADLAVSVTENKHSIAYLTDIFTKFNFANKELQGDNVTLITTKSTLKALSAQFKLFKSRLGRKDYSDFPCLKTQENVTDEELIIFCNHLENVVVDMGERFKNLFDMVVEDWVFNPFIDVEEVDSDHQNDLILLQNDEELKGRFKKSYQDFWLQEKLHARYPALWSKVQPYFVAFPTSYLVERGFSAVSLLLTKQRQKLQLNKRGDLRLFLTKITPSIKMLVENHQAQGSH